jgi:fused signal recognition particle receptor
MVTLSFMSILSKLFSSSPPPVAPSPLSFWERLKKSLSHSSGRLSQSLAELFTHKKLDTNTLNDLEDLLISADFGLETAGAMVAKLKSTRFEKSITSEEVKAFLSEEIETRLANVAKPLMLNHTPHIILVLGVNGVGKTTTIGKLANKFTKEGKSLMLIAGDTFRAAAVEQLKIWAERVGASFMSGKEGGDPASLAYEGIEAALAQKTDVVMIDTAGRLQNKAHLMEELSKTIRVIKKLLPDAPHDVLLVLDATTGQNALRQVETFKAIAGVTGLIMTKLDGTAKGGILVALADKFALPIPFIGIGEGIEDLEPFTAEEFAKALVDLK